MSRIVNLCAEKDCCPVVELRDNEVLIGEEGNLVTLTNEEWNTMKAKIIAGELRSYGYKWGVVN